MRVGRNIVLSLEPAAAPAANHRRHGRVRCQHTPCSAGVILDISASGARIRTRVKTAPAAGDRVTMIVPIEDDVAVRVEAIVKWVRAASRSESEFGAEFHDVDAPTRSTLARLARMAAHNEVLRDDPHAA